VNCLKNNLKMYIKIDIKTAATCFGAVTPSSGSALLVFAKVTVVKIASYQPTYEQCNIHTPTRTQ